MILLGDSGVGKVRDGNSFDNVIDKKSDMTWTNMACFRPHCCRNLPVGASFKPIRQPMEQIFLSKVGSVTIWGGAVCGYMTSTRGTPSLVDHLMHFFGRNDD